MNPTILTIIYLAFIFYTIGVFWEKKTGKLNYKHLIFFFLGLFFDLFSSIAMIDYSIQTPINFYDISGLFSNILIITHTCFAIYTIVSRNEKIQIYFNKYSIYFWIFWLTPFLSPLLAKFI